MLLLLPHHHAAAQRLHLVLVHPKTPLARCYAKKPTVAVSTIWQYCRKLSCISKVTDYMDYSVPSISNFYESMIVLFPPFCIKEVIK